MTSKKKSEEGLRRYNLGKDAEDWEYYKAKVNILNKVERHSQPNSPYDYTVKQRDPIKSIKKFLKDQVDWIG